MTIVLLVLMGVVFGFKAIKDYRTNATEIENKKMKLHPVGYIVFIASFLIAIVLEVRGWMKKSELEEFLRESVVQELQEDNSRKMNAVMDKLRQTSNEILDTLRVETDNVTHAFNKEITNLSRLTQAIYDSMLISISEQTRSTLDELNKGTISTLRSLKTLLDTTRFALSEVTGFRVFIKLPGIVGKPSAFIHELEELDKERVEFHIKKRGGRSKFPFVNLQSKFLKDILLPELSTKSFASPPLFDTASYDALYRELGLIPMPRSHFNHSGAMLHLNISINPLLYLRMGVKTGKDGWEAFAELGSRESVVQIPFGTPEGVFFMVFRGGSLVDSTKIDSAIFYSDTTIYKLMTWFNNIQSATINLPDTLGFRVFVSSGLLQKVIGENVKFTGASLLQGRKNSYYYAGEFRGEDRSLEIIEYLKSIDFRNIIVSLRTYNEPLFPIYSRMKLDLEEKEFYVGLEEQPSPALMIVLRQE